MRDVVGLSDSRPTRTVSRLLGAMGLSIVMQELAQALHVEILVYRRGDKEEFYKIIDSPSIIPKPPCRGVCRGRDQRAALTRLRSHDARKRRRKKLSHG